ncbi:MAG: hypothetical protein CBB61_003745 [Gammaproteobacteria bacterium TMED1]|nr:MAG: hypothetical protein CBB61_003745 [Gammaproteobacteria bacterium TMED1]|tara:strand:+ start:2583 stop:3011 length:429 start_codon:yes stop_codon:yes gene_type:complete
MKQLFQLTTQINTFSSENNAELVFLFDSLLLSLKTAAKHAGSQSILRATPSMKHAINLSKFLERALLRIPVPGLHDHISDLFDYFQRTLEENCGVPVEEELDELVMLTEELRKGINSLIEDKSIKAVPNTVMKSVQTLSTLH